MLYSQEKRQLFESQDVKFEEIEGWERVMVDSDSDDGDVLDPPSTRNGDPEGGHTDKTVDNDFVNAPSSSVKEADHQEISPSTPAHPSVPQPLWCSTHSNKGVLPVRPDEDPKLAQGSRPSTRSPLTLTVQDPVNTSVGTDGSDIDEDGPLLNIVDDDIDTLYLTADAPQLYREAMRCNDTDGWVEVVAEEYQNLCQKGIFVEVEVPPDAHVHKGHLVFTEKVRSEGEITRKKV